MERYEILEHRGDFKIRVFGKDKKELFLNALLGMNAGFRPEICSCLLPGSKHIRKIKSLDLNALLVDFLSEILYLIQTNKEIYNDVKFIKFIDTELEVELSGQKVESFGEDIKAVTHHGLDICQNKNKIWEVTIIFDI